ncbi:hypothetical protein [Oceanospirillum sediminis]|uniref:Uncharacterized protein n=1 Tax=Oceanospirillum sediminis TaxID=2760088 RepID=A0A839ISC2_9GAMM|nr:hypothetical protein [Oceanospirillum sediminis]MBB1487554.1 hypothetical protein [Oceanospirillum sediminis]
MKEQQIKAAITEFSMYLDQALSQPVSLSLRASLLHEAKKLDDTMKKIVTGQDAREQFFINTLEHFVACARLERTDMLTASCLAMKGEVQRLVQSVPYQASGINSGAKGVAGRDGIAGA